MADDMSRAYYRARQLFGDAAYVATQETIQDHRRAKWLEVGTKHKDVGTRLGVGRTWDDALREAEKKVSALRVGSKGI